jgi:hypothetical protein
MRSDDEKEKKKKTTEKKRTKKGATVQICGIQSVCSGLVRLMTLRWSTDDVL